MKIDRLMSIVLVLLDKKRVSARELADMFEVSLRTVYRDIDAIDLAGIPIRSIPGINGGFEIMPKYKLDNKVFTTSDLTAILTGLSGLSDMLRGDELLNAIAKIKSFIPAEKTKEIELKVNQIHIDLSEWMGNSNIQPYLETIKKALQENKLLAFDYIAHHGKKSIRIIEPYQLVLKSSHWYLHGYCRQRNDFRLFRLSRMSSLQLQEESFLPRNHQKPQLEFSDALAEIQTLITIRIHQSIMDRVLDYCTFESFSSDGDEHYLVQFPFVENAYHYDILLGFGNKCECLKPLRIRNELIRRIQETAAVYED